MDFYLIGFFVGITAALLIGLICWFLQRSRHPGVGKYDERQIIGRGKAFQAGFFTLLICGALCSILDYISPLPGGSFLWHNSVLLLGVAVFALTAIHYDAYVSMNDTPQHFIRMGWVFFFAMSGSGIRSLLTHDPKNHVLGIINLELAVIWLAIVLTLLHHRKAAEEEE